MLYKTRCEHTGIVNFFTREDPLISAGSIVEKAPGRFVWRCHVGEDLRGTAQDAGVAEAKLEEVVLRQSRTRRR
jgi:hypothetical protein